MYKYRFGNGLAFFEGKDIKLLEEMASKGYMPIGANGFGFYKFIQSAPEELSFSMSPSLLLLAGGSIGLAIAMSGGIIVLNYVRALKLKKGN